MATTRIPIVPGMNQPAMMHTPSWNGKGAGLRGIICFHGHDGDFNQIAQGLSWSGHPEYWAEKGYVVIGVFTGNHWDDTLAMQSGTDAYNYLINTIGISGPKVGIAGWSMGGGHAFRWLLDNPNKVAAGVTFAPDTDLDWSEQNAPWTAEIDALYGGSHATYLAQGSPRSPRNNLATFRGGPKMLVVHGTDDPTLPYSMNAGATGFVTLVNDPSVVLRQPDVTGGHMPQVNVPPRETWEWFRTKWAA